MDTAIDSAASCANCGTSLTGEYCHSCGQKRIDADWQSVPRFLRHFADELAHLDFRGVRSVAALFTPGKLPAEFLAGRRRRFLGPLKVYFICAALFFFLAPLVSGLTIREMVDNDATGTMRRLVDAQVARKQMTFELFAERFDSRIQTVYTLGLSVSVIAYALILKLLFRRAAPALATHLIFALYYIAFFYLLALMGGAIDKAAGGLHWLGSLGVMLGILLPYTFLAARRVYREPPARTFWKVCVLIAAGVIIDSPLNAAWIFLTFALI